MGATRALWPVDNSYVSHALAAVGVHGMFGGRKLCRLTSTREPCFTSDVQAVLGRTRVLRVVDVQAVLGRNRAGSCMIIHDSRLFVIGGSFPELTPVTPLDKISAVIRGDVAIIE